MSKAKTKTTKKDFEYFKERVRHWLNLYGVKEWCIHFRHSDDDDEALAQVEFDCRTGEAIFILLIDWGEQEINKSNIDECAFHEVLELRLGKIWDAACKREFDRAALDRFFHEFIRTAENVDFPILRKVNKS